MIWVAKIPLAKAQIMRQQLLEQGLLHPQFKAKRKDDQLWIPLRAAYQQNDIICEQVEEEFALKPQSYNAKQELEKILTAQERSHLKTSFDAIGTIAIMEVDEPLIHRQEQIAQAILKANPSIKTVVKKAGKHQGTFRTQKVQVIAGQPETVTIHRENGVALELDVGQVYFSPRLSTERKRMAKLISPDEEVLVMFSGCGPYVCVIAKMATPKRVVGVEANPVGHQYALANIKANRLANAQVYQGDVRQVVPDLGEFDRVVMPLPKSAEDFLDIALPATKQGGMIHLYAFVKEEELDQVYAKIHERCGQRNHKIVRTVRCGQHAPGVYRFCIDISV